jgi:hypothetical protein
MLGDPEPLVTSSAANKLVAPLQEEHNTVMRDYVDLVDHEWYGFRRGTRGR